MAIVLVRLCIIFSFRFTVRMHVQFYGVRWPLPFLLSVILLCLHLIHSHLPICTILLTLMRLGYCYGRMLRIYSNK